MYAHRTLSQFLWLAVLKYFCLKKCKLPRTLYISFAFHGLIFPKLGNMDMIPLADIANWGWGCTGG